MHPIHDIDVILLLATTLASKRRPAELVEVIAALDFMQRPIPAEGKLLESLRRLAKDGLISAQETGFALTPEALTIMASLPAKADTESRLYGIRDALHDYQPQGERALLSLTVEQIIAAIDAHRKAAKQGGKNFLMPKPKSDDLDRKRPAPWRRPGPARARRK